ncbi:MAG: methyltransferase domain-containing protein [Magnetococcales bacterium]|nr:methyltransferase domain-containing protein [Magnetococcales bacterium]
MLQERTGDKRAFERLMMFVQDRTGISVAPEKWPYLEGRIRSQMSQLGFTTLHHYCCWLLDGNGMENEKNALFDLVTINKTGFFRERHHFEFLSVQALPTMQARGIGMKSSLVIWSAGCSNGAEPYSLAMLCQDFANTVPGFKFQILASDLCTKVLQTAVNAIYPHVDVTPVPLPMRQRYLRRDPNRDEVRIVVELRQKVRFVHHNLMELPYPPQHPVDIIFCRNLLIYLKKTSQFKVLSQLCQHLNPGGFLFLGHSETLTGTNLPLNFVAPTTFLRQSLP